MQVLLLPLGALTLAAELSRCREVVERPTVTRLITGPPGVLGLVNVRGAAVPVLDTGALLGRPGTEAGAPAFVVVVDSAAGPAALAASACPEPAEVEAPSGPAGEVVVGTRVVTLVDVDALVAAVRHGG